ncbi:hypothetical protein ASE01_19355 [Nocardioides sp. Root190]|uniref:sialate O-acetylesterase n=1 Tax=Nocardioides sp. Root190 TaxID=1736488 RepID=UPI00070184FC|nr:sialate O-acetylesterase [Nocardioides sp. Root190]KRB74140.1 hypothetical protein ASE01_19355 [Nocardioides sp. Root190]
MNGLIDVFGVAGQSNAAGRGTASAAPITVAGLAHEFRQPDVLITPALDPFHGAAHGSAWPAFLDTFTAASGRPACIVSKAIGGSALLPAASVTNGHWSPTGLLRAAASAAYSSALTHLAAAGWTPVWRGVLWHQGENDAQALRKLPTLSAQYAAALIALAGHFATSVGPGEMYVLRLGDRQGFEDGYAAVRAGQDVACAAPGLTMAYDECAQFPARGWMRDPLHYAQVGLNHMGAGAARNVATHLGLLASAEAPPRGMTIARRLRQAL